MKNTKRKRSLLLTVLVLTVMFGVLEPKAAAAPELSEKNVTYMVADPVPSYSLDIMGVTKKSKITGLKSSKGNVAAVAISKSPFYKYVQLVVEPLNPGKTNISFKVKYGNKTKKLSLKVTVKKYENACASFKIGSKNYASKFGKGMFVTAKNPKKSQKISITAKKGWKLMGIRLNTKNGKITTIKNKTTVKMKKYMQIYADFYNSKKKVSSSLVLNLY